MSAPKTAATIPTPSEFTAQANNTGVVKERGDATIRRTGVKQQTGMLNQRYIPGQSFAPGIPAKETPSH
jgi:hypothetical protein